MTNEISAAATPREYGAEAGGAVSSLHAARHPIAARAADPSAAVPQRTTALGDINAGPSSQNLPGGDDAARLFWQRVTSGEIRLEPHEDRLIWWMRTRNRPWSRIAARILEMRAIGQRGPSKRSLAHTRRALRRARIAAAIRQMMERR